MSSLDPKREVSFKDEYFFQLLILSAIGVIAILFVLALAITPQSFYVQIGGV